MTCWACGQDHDGGTACQYPAELGSVYVTVAEQRNRRALDVAKAEAASRDRWTAMTNDDKAGVLSLVRETLLRLLADPSWVHDAIGTPMSSTALLQVTFTVALLDRDAALARSSLIEEGVLRDTLVGLSRQLSQPEG